MKAQAIFLGYKTLNTKEYTNEQGDVIPAFNGRKLFFYSSDWDEETLEIDGLGRTRTQNVNEKDLTEEMENLEIGQFCLIEVKESFNNNNYTCKYLRSI